MKRKSMPHYFLFCSLLLISPFAHAAFESISWQSYLIVGLIISVVASFFLARRAKTTEGLGVKIMIGCLYFWAISFAQLAVVGIVYYLMNNKS